MSNRQLLYFSVSRHNILPVTSRCGVSCLFCSHRYNPPGVRAVFFGELSLDTVAELLDLLDSKRKIVIGESATRLCEGEPFSHPQIAGIIQMLRRRFPDAPVQITTNGTGLNPDTVKLLSQAGPLELVISLNSADPAVRRRLMGSHDAAQALTGIAALPEAGIPWHASIVLLPHLTGWADVEYSLQYAAENGARTMRLLLPGFSGLAPVDWEALAAVPGEARAHLARWRAQYPLMPITLEPALPMDLRATVAGVLSGSPAANLLRFDDEITAINGVKPFSRVDAFYTLYRQANPRLTLLREGKEVNLIVPKPARSSSGVVMDRDLDPEYLEQAVAMAAGAERVLLLTSRWAEPLWSLAAPGSWQVKSVESRFFGGNIAAAGLLTVEDYRLALTGIDISGYQRILLPPLSFDAAGLDLCGEDCRALAAELPVPLVWA